MNKKELSASQAGEISLGNEISVHRLGYGAMRLTGEAFWVHRKTAQLHWAVPTPCCGVGRLIGITLAISWPMQKTESSPILPNCWIPSMFHTATVQLTS